MSLPSLSHNIASFLLTSSKEMKAIIQGSHEKAKEALVNTSSALYLLTCHFKIHVI